MVSWYFQFPYISKQYPWTPYVTVSSNNALENIGHTTKHTIHYRLTASNYDLQLRLYNLGKSQQQHMDHYLMGFFLNIYKSS